MTYEAASTRYDNAVFRRTGRSGLMLPALLLAVADGEALYLFARGCALRSGGFWQATGLVALASANMALLASALHAWRQGRVEPRRHRRLARDRGQARRRPGSGRRRRSGHDRQARHHFPACRRAELKAR